MSNESPFAPPTPGEGVDEAGALNNPAFITPEAPTEILDTTSHFSPSRTAPTPPSGTVGIPVAVPHAATVVNPLTDAGTPLPAAPSGTSYPNAVPTVTDGAVDSSPATGGGTKTLGILAVVFATMALLPAIVPVLNLVTYPFGFAAVVLGIVGLRRVKTGRAAGKGLLVTGVILSIAALALATFVNVVVVRAASDVVSSIPSGMEFGSSSPDITVTATPANDGAASGPMTASVSVVNTTGSTADYQVTVAFLDSSGITLGTDSVTISGVPAGSSQSAVVTSIWPTPASGKYTAQSYSYTITNPR